MRNEHKISLTLPREVVIERLGVSENDYDKLEEIDRKVNRNSQMASTRLARYLIAALAKAKEIPYASELYRMTAKDCGTKPSLTTYYATIRYLLDEMVIHIEDGRALPIQGARLVTRVFLNKKYEGTLKKYSSWLS